MLRNGNRTRRGNRRRGQFRGRRTRRQPNSAHQSQHSTASLKLSHISNSGDFMPSQFRTSLRIAFERSAAASTSLGTIALLGNDIFDPLGSAGTAQPVGFDPLALLYNRYRVIGSSVQIRGTLQSDSTAPLATAVGGDLVFYPSNSPNAPSTYEDAVAQPFAKYGPLTSQTPQVWKHSMSTAEITGQAGMRSSDRLNAAVSASPGEQWYWVVVFKSAANYSSVNLEWHIQITYDVEFYDRALLNESSLSTKLLRKACLMRLQELNIQEEKQAEARAQAKQRSQDAITLQLEQKELKTSVPTKLHENTGASTSTTAPISVDSQGHARVSPSDPDFPHTWVKLRPGTPVRAIAR